MIQFAYALAYSASTVLVLLLIRDQGTALARLSGYIEFWNYFFKNSFSKLIDKKDLIEIYTDQVSMYVVQTPKYNNSQFIYNQKMILQNILAKEESSFSQELKAQQTKLVLTSVYISTITPIFWIVANSLRNLHHLYLAIIISGISLITISMQKMYLDNRHSKFKSRFVKLQKLLQSAKNPAKEVEKKKSMPIVSRVEF